MKPSLPLLAVVLVCTLPDAGAGEPIPAKNAIPLTPAAPVESCLSYDFVDLEYGINDFGSPFYGGGEFWGIGFAKSLGETFYLTGGYGSGGYEFDACCALVDVETKRYRLGLGARRPLAPCIDLTLEGGFNHTESEYERYPVLDYDSWGYYVGPGLRARAGRFEFFANAFFTSREGDMSQTYLSWQTFSALSEDEDGWVFNPGIIYHLTEHWGVKLAAELGELDNAFTFGLRGEF